MYTPTKFFGVLWAKRLCGYSPDCIAKDTRLKRLENQKPSLQDGPGNQRQKSNCNMVVFDFALSRFLFTVDQVFELIAQQRHGYRSRGGPQVPGGNPGFTQPSGSSGNLSSSGSQLGGYGGKLCFGKVAALLGHESLDTTRLYVTPGERDLEQAVGSLVD